VTFFWILNLSPLIYVAKAVCGGKALLLHRVLSLFEKSVPQLARVVLVLPGERVQPPLGLLVQSLLQLYAEISNRSGCCQRPLKKLT
jgi:hypothetical protein